MSDEFDLVRGSGHVFRDLGRPNADLEQARAVLAAKIIGVLDKRKLSVRAAEKLTSVGAAEFSRIRNARLDRFTLDRLIAILGKLDRSMEVSVRVKQRRAPLRSAPRTKGQRTQNAGATAARARLSTRGSL